jgi:hypothetical protein
MRAIFRDRTCQPGHEAGSLDLLCTISHGLSYEQLLPNSESMDQENGLEIRVLGLETLIELKEQLGGEKDWAMLHCCAERWKRSGEAEQQDLCVGCALFGGWSWRRGVWGRRLRALRAVQPVTNGFTISSEPEVERPGISSV